MLEFSSDDKVQVLGVSSIPTHIPIAICINVPLLQIFLAVEHILRRRNAEQGKEQSKHRSLDG
jgi:hypothetical protein